MGDDRDRFSSRLAFIFTAMGSAIGFGNVWRFPSLVYGYGGGSFFIPYLLALFFIGLPTLLLEIALGQYYQKSNAGLFGSIHSRLVGVGLAGVTNSFLLVCYYSALIAWVIREFSQTFTAKSLDWNGATSADAFDYFVEDILEMSTNDTSQWPTLLPTTVSGVNFAYLALTWFMTFLCVAWGLGWTGRITYFTMGFPIVLLVIFLIRAVTLVGARSGVKAYIGVWDLSQLTTRPDIWSTAAGQIFFSLSIAEGAMTAFGSYCDRDAPAFSNACWVAGANSLFSFLAGFAVFASLGHLAYVGNTTLDKVVASGPALVFAAWPVILAKIPGGVNWVRLHFVNLFLLGLDSAFALVEGSLAVLKDTNLLRSKPHPLIAACTCVVGLTIGLLYVTDTGFLFLNVVDFYVNFMLIFVGFLETFSAGWVYGIEKQVLNLGRMPVLSYMATTFVSVILASGLWFGLPINALWGGFVGGLLCYTAGMVITAFLLKMRMDEQPDRWTWKTIIIELLFRNALDLQSDLSAVVGFIPKGWSLMIKHLIPQILLILFINLASAKNPNGLTMFGNYGSYVKWPYQILGIIFFFVVSCFFLVGVAAPSSYSCFVASIEDGDSVEGKDTVKSNKESESAEEIDVNDSRDEKSGLEEVPV